MRPTLRMRCTVERDQGADDAYGAGEDWQPHLSDVACWWWVATGREAISSDRTVVIADERLIVDLDVDVAAGDRVTEVTNRGTTIFAGSDWREVEHVARTVSHQELALRATS